MELASLQGTMNEDFLTSHGPNLVNDLTVAVQVTYLTAATVVHKNQAKPFS